MFRKAAEFSSELVFWGQRWMLEVAVGCHNEGREAEDFWGSANLAAGERRRVTV